MSAIRLIGQAFDASVGPQEDGTMRLPAWLRYRCATAETSAQTGPSTVRTGFGANAARAFSRDGVSWGLLVEPATENLVTEQNISQWTVIFGVSSLIFQAAMTPAGTLEACEVGDDDAGASESYAMVVGALAAGTWTAAMWMQVLEAEGSQFLIRDQSTFTSHIDISHVGPDAEWVRRDGTVELEAPTDESSTHARVVPRFPSTSTGFTRYWGMQLEARAYPTSFIGADNATFTRAAGTLSAPAAAIAPGGFLTPILRYRPHYAHTEAASDHHLLYLDAGRRLYFDASAALFVLELGGETLTVGPVTFSRHQELTVQVDHSEERVRLIVSGATTGNGIAIGAGQPAFELGSEAYVLGGPDGAEEGSDLRYLAPCQSFCGLVSTRHLAQMSQSPSNFRDLMCILSEGPARDYDAAIAVREGFDLDTAIGVQLDMIGSIVGLRREGFEDERYRDFLRIQVELLLAVARDEAKWTGTTENIIKIARTFIGDTGGRPVVYIATPPYAFILSVPGLDLAEYELLLRFVRTAVYAGVSGLVFVVLAEHSLWGDDVVSIPNEGVWGDDVVSIPNAATWGFEGEL